MSRTLTVFLGGDVMTGRGVDQILPHPGDPTLRERYVRDAREYVELAEAVNGPIPRPVDPGWIWGDALNVLDAAAPDLRLINLESSITARGEFERGKAVHYRMNPANIGCLTVVRPDACVLANNHVLDFGEQGLADTLDALAGAGLRAVGAGVDLDRAQAPAILGGPHGGRFVILSCGAASSGVPPTWAAASGRPGIDYLPETSAASAAAIASRVRAAKRPGDIVIVSVHWGSNWGYQVGRRQVRFAHALVEAGADVVYGHSSHHPRPIEVYRKRLVLYGCGDLVDDYEGITGYEQYRDDLRLLYLVALRADTGELAGLRMVCLQARQMRLQHAPAADTRWLGGRLDQVSRRFGTRIAVDGGALAIS